MIQPEQLICLLEYLYLKQLDLCLLVHDHPFEVLVVGMVIGLILAPKCEVWKGGTYGNHHLKEEHLMREGTLIFHIPRAWILQEVQQLLHHLVLLIPASIAQSQLHTFHQFPQFWH